ncbi:MAG: hypothetical protein HC772_16555, partial [Leptolyngbyaceae cyanobacterium CRU_2_3]|nr:hypothetical protein [Leptolyngbyaceae cyanobacterium CRU_2_3]
MTAEFRIWRKAPSKSGSSLDFAISSRIFLLVLRADLAVDLAERDQRILFLHADRLGELAHLHLEEGVRELDAYVVEDPLFEQYGPPGRGLVAGEIRRDHRDARIRRH